jgi:hypothetical protein
MKTSGSRATALAVLLAAYLVAACGPEGNDPVEPGSWVSEELCLKCDGLEPDGTLSLRVPGEAAALRVYLDVLRDDQQVDGDEAAALAAFVKRFGGRNERIAAFLQARVDEGTTLDPAAREVLRRAVAGERPNDVPLANEVYEVVPGSQPFLFDDALYLLGDGRVEGHTGLVSHSRGYAAKRDGVLFTRHGSLAPHYEVAGTPAGTEALNAQAPSVALDRAAEVYGLHLDSWSTFDKTAHDPNYYAPGADTPYWAGICQGWTHNALDNRLSRLVDVDGDEGRRGLWIFGQWISRADLGNAMMGASFSLGIADSTTIDSFVTPEGLVKALAQYVLRSGTGLRVDIWNDAHNATGTYNPQIWNQPVVAGSIEVASVSTETGEAVLAHTRSAGWGLPEGAQVKLVRTTAVWGVEANDSWEGEPLYKESEWNAYLVTAADGRVLKGYMAHELAAEGVGPLPVTASDGLPDYIAVPRHELTDAALEGRPHNLLDSGHGDGLRFRFLVGTVLARGIPDATRQAFETEVLGGNTDAESLAARYPGIANAYGPDQWQHAFAPVLGPGERFGAVWGEAGL